ncbi:hypothetical protein IJO12_02590 [bacterium]|nr:hypothetical protein [bacterium]
MSDFKENNNLIGFDGVIGRRNFIVNILWIELIEALLYSTVLIYMISLNPDFMAQFKLGAQMPHWHNLWVVGIGAFSSCLYFPNILRRLRDIQASEDSSKTNLMALFLTVMIFACYLPFLNLGKFLQFFIIIWLVFQQGKITGAKPKNELIKFNWGAFLCTWVWGIYNKVWITLLMLPLMLTAAWFPFMLICGLKGNEWAYKNYKTSDIANFHKSQITQTKVLIFAYPILLVICGILITVVSVISLGMYAEKNPEFVKNMESKALQMETSMAKSGFDNIVLTDNEYKFYINPKIWVKLSKKQKSSMFQSAVAYVYSELKLEKPKDKKALFEQSSEISGMVKIYSSFNNELLGEYKLTAKEVMEAFDKIGEAGGFKRYYDMLQNSYKFNEYPSLP